MNYQIKSEKLTVTISSLGAELVSAVGNDGFEYVWQNETGEFWGGHAPLLFPHCARILNSEYTYGGKRYEMNSHGFARRSEFELVSQSDSEVVLSLKSSDATRVAYPFDFELIAEYKVAENALFANYTVQNKDKKALPYMFGWHPGFNLDCKNGAKIDDFSVKFDDISECDWYPMVGMFVSPVSQKYALPESKYQLSEKEIYENDTLIFVGTGTRAYLSAPKAEHTVDLSYSENLPYFCIWKYASSKAKYICLEPWSNVPGDGVTPENFETKKMERLPSGESATYAYCVKFN